MSPSAQTKDTYRLIHDGILAFGRAERHGIRVDVEYCEKKKVHLTRKIKYIKNKLQDTELLKLWKKIYGNKVKLSSNYQLSYLLYTIMKLKPVKVTTGGKKGKKQGATDEESLSALDIPELNKILEIRKLAKVRDTYLDGFLREQVDGVIHPFGNLHLARTFRSSMNSPNFQNIPIRDIESMKICRSALSTRPGYHWLAVDYSGVEVRMACVYTEDPTLIHDTLHGNMHKDMAIELYLLDGLDKGHSGEKNLYQGAKNGFVFPQFYGDYSGNCAPNLLSWAKIASLKDGTPGLVHLSDKGLVKLNKKGKVINYEKFLRHVENVEDDFWNVRYKVYSKWKKKWWEDYQKRGYIDMLTGFRCKDVMDQKQCCNTPFQGTAFHCLLWSFIRIDQICYEEENWDSKIMGQIHDEISIDTYPDELEHVAETVQRVSCTELPKEWKWISIPLEVDADLCEVGDSWAKKKPYKLPEVI